MNEKGQIIHRGMGGFLCPPGHPMHTHSVQIDLHRRPENRGGMSLECAANCRTLDNETRVAAQVILTTWQPLPLASPEIQDWILQVLGYFRHCYCSYAVSGLESTDWYVDNLVINGKRDPLEHADRHAGVYLIRHYYPAYKPLHEHFKQAYWGKKPCGQIPC